MTLVRNLLQRLSGNNTFFYTFLLVILLSTGSASAQNNSKRMKFALMVPLNFQNLKMER